MREEIIIKDIVNSREAVINCLTVRVQPIALNPNNHIWKPNYFIGIEKYLSLSFSDGKSLRTIENKKSLEKILTQFSISISDAWKYAEDNLRKNVKIFNIKDIFPFPVTPTDIATDMLVVTNETMFGGAAAITDDVILLKIGKMLNSKKFIIFPSSIHEVIVTPYTDDMDISKCKSIVKMINGDASCISPEIVLSYNIFLIHEVNGNIFVDIK